jgi:hypothetical protein
MLILILIRLPGTITPHVASPPHHACCCCIASPSGRLDDVSSAAKRCTNLVRAEAASASAAAAAAPTPTAAVVREAQGATDDDHYGHITTAILDSGRPGNVRRCDAARSQPLSNSIAGHHTAIAQATGTLPAALSTDPATRAQHRQRQVPALVLGLLRGR